MEEDTLISISATPSYENTSTEEIRWKDYQAKQAVASQMIFNVVPSSPFIVSNMSNGDAPPSESQFVAPNPVDHLTPICKFCNNGASLLALPLAVSAAGLNSGSLKGNPSSPVSSASPFSGLNSQLQAAPQTPLGSSSAALGLSPAVPSMSTVYHPMQTSSGAKAHSEKASCLEWPQSSLQAPILSTPSPVTTIISSPSADGEDSNMLLQRDLTQSAAENSYAVTSGMFKFSNTEGGSLVRHGISSLPDAPGKYSHPRTVSLLTSRKVFQKTVIRMQSRRQGSLKKDGPRVSFLDDYSDPDASYVAHRNPKELLLRTPQLDSSAMRSGALKDESIKAM